MTRAAFQAPRGVQLLPVRGAPHTLRRYVALGMAPWTVHCSCCIQAAPRHLSAPVARTTRCCPRPSSAAFAYLPPNSFSHSAFGAWHRSQSWMNSLWLPMDSLYGVKALFTRPHPCRAELGAGPRAVHRVRDHLERGPSGAKVLRGPGGGAVKENRVPVEAGGSCRRFSGAGGGVRGWRGGQRQQRHGGVP